MVVFDFDDYRQRWHPERVADDDGRPLPVEWEATFVRFGGSGADFNHPDTTDVGCLTVRFSATGDVTGVSLDKPEGTVTPTELRRFPWDRWIRVARSARTTSLEPPTPDGPPISVDEAMAVLDAAKLAEAAKRAKQRPGRRGHPGEHYESVAARYNALVAAGVTSPVKALTEQAAEQGEPVSHNTMSTWVKKCRQLGLIPPGRPRRQKVSNEPEQGGEEMNPTVSPDEQEGGT